MSCYAGPPVAAVGVESVQECRAAIAFNHIYEQLAAGIPSHGCIEVACLDAGKTRHVVGVDLIDPIASFFENFTIDSDNKIKVRALHEWQLNGFVILRLQSLGGSGNAEGEGDC